MVVIFMKKKASEEPPVFQVASDNRTIACSELERDTIPKF
jgi:hypothetical protein